MTTHREAANAVIRDILKTLDCTIIREPSDTFGGGFVASLPGGERFFIQATSLRYNGPCRIEVSASWGEYPTVRGSSRPERDSSTLSSRSFLPTGVEGCGSPSVDPSRPLPVILKDLDRRFFGRLKELWPLAEAYRAKQEGYVTAYLATANECARLKHKTRGGYSLQPNYIGHAGEYARFELDIPADKLESFFNWCQENEVAR